MIYRRPYQLIFLLNVFILTGCYYSKHTSRVRPEQIVHTVIDTTQTFPEYAGMERISPDKYYYEMPSPLFKVLPQDFTDSSFYDKHGTIAVEAYVVSSGKVIWARIFQGRADSKSKEEILRAVIQWRFRPAMGFGNKPIGAWISLGFRRRP